jgi:hypothetical protein
MAQARPEVQTRVRLDLGKVYLELMYYADSTKNTQIAIEHFEWVLERSKKKEELVEASNYKTQALWWKHATGPTIPFSEVNGDFPLRMWAKSVATTYKDDTTAVCYYAMSSIWLNRVGSDDLTWLDLAWCLLRSRHQSPPPGFHYIYSRYACTYSRQKRRQNGWQFRDLSFLVSALEHLTLFTATLTLKDMDMTDRCVIILIIETFMAYLTGTKIEPSLSARIWVNASESSRCNTME